MDKKNIQKDRGLRYNKGKLSWSLVDFESFEDMVRVLEIGAKKYSDNNWKKGFPLSEVMESLLRHAFAIMKGEMNDLESGLSHIAHIQSNAMFAAYIVKNKPEFNDLIDQQQDNE